MFTGFYIFVLHLVLSLTNLFVLQETIPMEEVYENLRCSKNGLTSEDARRRLEIYGHNKLEEKTVCTVPYLRI